MLFIQFNDTLVQAHHIVSIAVEQDSEYISIMCELSSGKRILIGTLQTPETDQKQKKLKKTLNRIMSDFISIASDNHGVMNADKLFKRGLKKYVEK